MIRGVKINWYRICMCVIQESEIQPQQQIQTKMVRNLFSKISMAAKKQSFQVALSYYHCCGSPARRGPAWLWKWTATETSKTWIVFFKKSFKFHFCFSQKCNFWPYCHVLQIYTTKHANECSLKPNLLRNQTFSQTNFLLKECIINGLWFNQIGIRHSGYSALVSCF